MILERSSTLFLRTVIVLMGLIVLAFCIFVLPEGIRTSVDWTGYRPILLGMYVPAVPFFIGLYQSLKLLNYVDKNKAFSKGSFKALNIIKYCAGTISVIYAIGLPFIFRVADMDDAPGVVLIGLAFTFAPMAIAVVAAILQKMLKNAINLKSQNDLTV
jgi:hypothetical protein